MDRLKRKYETARKYVPAPFCTPQPGATIGIIGFGSTEAAILEAVYQLSTEHGIQADFLRVRALPFTQEVTDFINKYDQIFVVEMNRDGQMKQILSAEYSEKAANFKSVAYGDGMPAAAKWVREGNPGKVCNKPPMAKMVPALKPDQQRCPSSLLPK